MAKVTVVKKKYRIKGGDFVLTALVAALVVFGIIMVFSASYYASISETGDPYDYLKSNLMWAGVGTVAMIVCTLLDYHVYKKLAPWLMGISFILLLLIFTPLGLTRNNATRWLGVEGFPITLMPGEIAKICAIIFVAWFLSQNPKRIHQFWKGVLPLVLLAGAYFVLILKQPNMSTALTLLMIIVGMMFVAGLSWWYVAAAVGAAGGGFAVLWFFFPDSYFMDRILSFTDPFADPLGDGWQVTQGLLALGSGGLFGKGLGKSIQKTLYLPEPQNDFILAIIGEELGFVGCFLLIAVYLVLIWRCCHICLNAPDLFGTLLASGITIMLALQVILNIAVVTSSMPPTGIALPFISYGGNSLLIFMASMGILLNISRHSAK
ncbi:MAG: putative lipid II flippase FtsW [Clostridiales bacterium]|nr:putative lipid II flippase FtsW [Clostridiales bacterium]